MERPHLRFVVWVDPGDRRRRRGSAARPRCRRACAASARTSCTFRAPTAATVSARSGSFATQNTSSWSGRPAAAARSAARCDHEVDQRRGTARGRPRGGGRPSRPRCAPPYEFSMYAQRDQPARCVADGPAVGVRRGERCVEPLADVVGGEVGEPDRGDVAGVDEREDLVDLGWPLAAQGRGQMGARCRRSCEEGRASTRSGATGFRHVRPAVGWFRGCRSARTSTSGCRRSLVDPRNG